MATESPIRMLETSGKWPYHKKAVNFSQTDTNMATDELGLLLKGHRFPGSVRDAVPNRSGSAPPSMEGSFLAISNLISQQNSSMDASLAGLSSAIKKCESEEQLRADPAYLAYYCSNVNLNPRLPPPLISWENRRLVRHIGSFGNKWELTSIDDSGSSSLHLSRGALSTHNEESEDDRSPHQPYHGWVERASGLWSEQRDSSLAGQPKSLVDLIQEDFPRTPSPLYNQANSLSHGLAEEEAVGHDTDSSSLNGSSVRTLTYITSTPDADDKGLSLNVDSSVATVLENENIRVLDEMLIEGVNKKDSTMIESRMKALEICSSPNPERSIDLVDHSCQNSLAQYLIAQQTKSTEVESAKSQTSTVNNTYNGMDQFQSPSKFSAQVHPVMQSSGFTPPLYTATAAYMTSANPFNPNLQPTGLLSPQYSAGGYALNSNGLPYIAAYPPQSAIPLGFDGSVGPSFNSQMSGGSIAHGADIRHLNRFYGQLGFPLQPSLVSPHYIQYYQQTFGDGYSFSGPFSPSLSGGGVFGNQVGAFNSYRGPDIAAGVNNQQLQHQRAGGLNELNSGRGGIMSSNHYGTPLNMGILMQNPLPRTSPIFPGSPGSSLAGGRNEMRFPPVAGRNASLYPGLQGHVAFESYNAPKIYNFLEELKSGKGRRFELSDITGHIVEFSANQHGSRFIQQKLENCSAEEKISVFKEVLPHASKLMTDVFGNYVIQKFFEYGSPEQRKELANQLTGLILPLSLQMYGCRVIQKALEVIELEQKAQLIFELDGHVMRCVRDQNGNHVIQKCIESVPTNKIGFIISAFRGQVATLAMHPYGCRVIQRVLEHCTDEMQCQFIVDEILESVYALAQDQYGNYVTQHVLERGKPYERRQIIGKLAGHIVQLSQHKFASNVIEKCLEYGGTPERDQLIEEIVGKSEGNENLLTMVKDQYANYVVQKALEICSDNQRVLLLSRIKFHVQALKKYTYGKHIVARFEQLLGEENQTLGS